MNFKKDCQFVNFTNMTVLGDVLKKGHIEKVGNH